MRKPKAILLAAVLLVSLSGCSLFDKPGNDTDDPSGQGGTQTVEVENKVALSIDKEHYDKEETIEVSLKFKIERL